MPTRYLVVTECQDGTARYLIVDSLSQYGSGARVIASGPFADPIREMARLANEAHAEAEGRKVEADLLARLDSAVAE